MKHIDSGRANPPPLLGGAAGGVAAVIVVVAGLFISLVACTSQAARVDATMEPTTETFTAISTVAAPSSMPTLAATLVPSPAAPSLSAAPVSSALPVADVNQVATRVKVPQLHIDLAVIAPPKDVTAYPKCGVAMYLARLHQPGQVGATYLYAHAREGMFLPIYQRAIQKLHGGPKSMLGMRVEVFTSDDLRYLYDIEEVRVHQTSLVDAAHAQDHELWLQTSEGPKGTRGKTQVRAVLVGVRTASHEQAHPAPRPVTCG
jgi:hypothetical protein